MDDSLNERQKGNLVALTRIYEIDKGLTNLETLLNHQIDVWVEDGKLKYKVPDKTPEELTPERLHNIKTMAARCKPDIIAAVSDPDSLRKTLSVAQSALAELFNHSNILEDELERLSAIVKRRNNDNNR